MRASHRERHGVMRRFGPPLLAQFFGAPQAVEVQRDLCFGAAAGSQSIFDDGLSRI
jgi:hypothetical protein